MWGRLTGYLPEVSRARRRFVVAPAPKYRVVRNRLLPRRRVPPPNQSSHTTNQPNSIVCQVNALPEHSNHN